MKCKDCNCAKKGFFSYQPEDYVCIGVKEPFVIGDINAECTEYESKRNMKMTREEAIKNITTYLYAEFENIPKQVIEAMQMAIESLGNNTNVGSKWIPCSERLPKREEMVLLSVKLDEEPMLIMGELWISGWTLFGDGYDEEDFEFVAWQPLPEPYKEGDT